MVLRPRRRRPRTGRRRRRTSSTPGPAPRPCRRSRRPRRTAAGRPEPMTVDHRAVGGVDEQTARRLAHRRGLGTVVRDGDPAAQPPGPDERMVGCGHAVGAGTAGPVVAPGTGASWRSRPSCLSSAHSSAGDGGPERLDVPCLLGRTGRAGDHRRDRRMPERELERRRRQRDAVALADRGDPPCLVHDRRRGVRVGVPRARAPAPWPGSRTRTPRRSRTPRRAPRRPGTRRRARPGRAGCTASRRGTRRCRRCPGSAASGPRSLIPAPMAPIWPLDRSSSSARQPEPARSRKWASIGRRVEVQMVEVVDERDVEPGDAQAQPAALDRPHDPVVRVVEDDLVGRATQPRRAVEALARRRA